MIGKNSVMWRRLQKRNTGGGGGGGGMQQGETTGKKIPCGSWEWKVNTQQHLTVGTPFQALFSYPNFGNSCARRATTIVTVTSWPTLDARSDAVVISTNIKNFLVGDKMGNLTIHRFVLSQTIVNAGFSTKDIILG